MPAARAPWSTCSRQIRGELKLWDIAKSEVDFGPFILFPELFGD